MKRLSHIKRNMQVQARSQTVSFLKTLTGEILMALILQINMLTRATVALAILFPSLKLLNPDLS